MANIFNYVHWLLRLNKSHLLATYEPTAAYTGEICKLSKVFKTNCSLEHNPNQNVVIQVFHFQLMSLDISKNLKHFFMSLYLKPA